MLEKGGSHVIEGFVHVLLFRMDPFTFWGGGGDLRGGEGLLRDASTKKGSGKVPK